MNKLAQLPKPFFVLAPMDDVTDTVFRQIVADCAMPDLFFTEFVNVDGLQSPGRDRLLKKLQFTAGETSLVAQLWGLNPENFYKTARQIADGSFAREFGLPEGVNFAGIDLNMGCPAKSEVKSGACAALINNRPLAVEIIKATQAGAVAGSGSDGACEAGATGPNTTARAATAAVQTLPVSVKTRLGFNDVDFSWHELLLQQSLSMLTIHGRTRKEMSKVPAHWDDIGTIRELRDKLAPDTLLVGNGDVSTRQEGERLAAKYGLDGIMVGRGIFHDPFLFAASHQDHQTVSQDTHQNTGQTPAASPWPAYTREQRIALYTKHVKLFAATWGNHDRRIATLNKFCKIYISDFDGAKELREQLMQASSTEELLKLLASA